MPQGKGTYGSKVGRPKKKYDNGGSVDPFSTRNPEGVPAEQLAEARNTLSIYGKMDKKNMANQGQGGLPTANAQERSQASPMGNEVGTGVYKEGGKVKQGSLSDKVKSSQERKQRRFKGRKAGETWTKSPRTPPSKAQKEDAKKKAAKAEKMGQIFDKGW